MSTDPAKENWNLYTAFNNNPIIFVDPDGTENTIYIWYQHIPSYLNSDTKREIFEAELRAKYITRGANENLQVKPIEARDANQMLLDRSKFDNSDALVVMQDISNILGEENQTGHST